MNDGHEEPARTPEDVCTGCPASEQGDTRRGPPEDPEKLPTPKPSNAYEFGQAVSAISARKDAAACARLLAGTEPRALPALLSNKLEGDLFVVLLQALGTEPLRQDPSLVYQHLLHLSRAERFKVSGQASCWKRHFTGFLQLQHGNLFMLIKRFSFFQMMLTLISKGQKEQIEQLFDDLSDTPNKHFTLEDVQALKRQYEL